VKGVDAAAMNSIRPTRCSAAAAPFLAILIALFSGAAGADEDIAEPSATQSRYVIGASGTSAAEYQGSNNRDFKLRPLWAYQYGRFRISTSRASGVLGFATDTPLPGASAEVLSTDTWRVGGALRFDSGRKASDSPYLAGMPDVERTLRGRIYASYALTKSWGIGGNVSQDLLGRNGGALASMDIGFRHWLTPRTEWTTGGGLSFGDARNMQTYFGVTDADAVKTGLPAFSPGAGLKDVHAGIGLTTALTKRWIVFANVGGSKLLGDAAASPLTKEPSSFSATAGVAYRCCD
jgi:outer membrane scaffolding protein for murein synthesis (MipA/OmpV family)